MLTSRRTIRVEWGDCDPAGIVHFPRYFGWLDACTSALFDLAGLTKEAFAEQYGPVSIPIVDTHATFYKPSSYGEDIAVESTITRWGKTSFNVQHKVIRPDGLAAEITEVRVWTLPEKNGAPYAIKPHPIPPDVIARFDRG